MSGMQVFLRYTIADKIMFQIYCQQELAQLALNRIKIHMTNIINAM